MYDLIIIGGGPAGMSAAIYAARKKIKILLITKELGGQMIESYKIDNYLGMPNLSGVEMVQKFIEHLKKIELEIKELEIKENETVKKISADSGIFKIITDKSEYKGRTIIIATGKSARQLKVPGAKKFIGKGVVYCATCDAPLFGDKIVAVVGAGDAGLSAAWQLTKYAKKIYIINRSQEFRSDDIILKEKIESHPKITILNNTQVKEIKGTDFVESLVYQRKEGGEEEIKVNGIFVEIGSVPNSGFIKGLIELNEKQEIITDLKDNSTSLPGIFAAGDVTDIIHKQIIVAAGEGAKAALSVYEYLKNL